MTSGERVTAELLGDIGYSATEVDQMRSTGIIV